MHVAAVHVTSSLYRTGNLDNEEQLMRRMLLVGLTVWELLRLPAKTICKKLNLQAKAPSRDK